MRGARMRGGLIVAALLASACREPCPSEPAGLRQWFAATRGGCVSAEYLCSNFTVDRMVTLLSNADRRLLAEMDAEQTDLQNLFALVRRMRRRSGCADPDWAAQFRPVEDAPRVLLRLGIGPKGLLVAGSAGVLPTITKVGGEHDWEGLDKHLDKVKRTFPEETQLFLFADPTVTIAELQRALAIARGPGLVPRFETTIIPCERPFLSENGVECEEWRLPVRPPRTRSGGSAQAD